MQSDWSYLTDSGNFLNKTKNLSCLPDSAILVATDIVGLYPTIPLEASLKTLREALKKENEKSIPKEDLVNITEFVLKNNFF